MDSAGSSAGGASMHPIDIQEQRWREQNETEVFNAKYRGQTKSDFDEDIDPNIGAGKWKKKRHHFREQLTMPNKTVLNVVEENLLEEHMLYLLPPTKNNEILRIQNEHAQLYKESLAPGGRFSGQKDNLATKLTMLFFGWPIEPITLNNINNSAKEGDEDDLPDDEVPLPRVQRIIYAEKPLEFLDKYNERSYGFPILRRVKPMSPPPNNLDSDEVNQRDGAENPTKLDEAEDYPMHDGGDSVNSDYPMSSESAPTRLRGGAGGIRSSDDAENRTVYGPRGQYSVVSYAGGAAGFLGQALAMLSLRPTQDTYQFHVDIYNNRENDKAQKPYQRTLDIDNNNFHEMYKQSIERPLFNFEHDWLLAVDPPRGKTAKAPQTFNPTASSVHVPPKTPPEGPLKKSPFFKSPRKNFGIGKELHAGHRRKSPPRTLKIHKVYGYPGILTHQDKEYDLFDAALKIAGIDFSLSKPWTMHVYLPSFQGAVAQPPGHNAETFRSTQSRRAWEETWDISIAPHLASSNPPRPIFAWSEDQNSAERWTNDMFQPKATDTSIIRLELPNGDTAYWRLAENLSPEHGINQIQPNFRGAMKFLFGGEPPGHVTIDNIDLGVPGMELTPDLVDRVLKTPETQWLTFPVRVRTRLTTRSLRLIGSSRLINPKTVADTRTALEEAVDTFCGPGTPKSVKIWISMESCENGIEAHSRIIHLEYKGKVETDLRALTRNSATSLPIPFRPNWTSLVISDSDMDKNTTTWNLAADEPTLANFRKKLAEIFPALLSSQDVRIGEVGASAEDNRSFRITKDTTENDWRVNVFNWLHSGNIIVGLMPDALTYNINDSPYGAKPYVSSDTVPGPLMQKTPRIFPQWPRHHQPLATTSGNVANANPKPPAKVVPERNMERYIAPKAGRAHVPTWEVWTKSESWKDRLQRESYVKDQSAVLPGKDPVAPLYGEARELQISGGESTSSIYTQRVTPTDIAQLQTQAQKMRNHTLERMTECPICGVTFAGHETDTIAEHYKRHQDKEKTDGECCWCADTNWTYMTAPEKRAHFLQHMKNEESSVIKKFWEDTRCPACDQDFKGWNSEAIVAHCINKHQPGVVQFCTKCGIRTHELDNLELDHHKSSCLDKPELPKGQESPANYCRQCGKDLTKDELGSLADTLHKRDCKPRLQHYHSTCGIEMTGWTQMTIQRHRQHCHPPGGWKGKFCQRCGQDLWNMEKDSLKLSNHMETCRKRVEPVPILRSHEYQELLQKKQQVEAELARQVVQAATLHNAEKEIRDLQRTLQDLHAQVARNPDRIAKLESHNKDLTEQIRSIMASRNDVDAKSQDMGACPFPNCEETLSKKSRAVIVAHLTTHIYETSDFSCPLLADDGTLCSCIMNTHDPAAVSGHYVHKHQGAAPFGTSVPSGLSSQAKDATSRLNADNLFNTHLLNRDSNNLFGSSPIKAAQRGQYRSGVEVPITWVAHEFPRSSRGWRRNQDEGGGGRSGGGFSSAGAGSTTDDMTEDQFQQKIDKLEAELHKLENSKLPETEEVSRKIHELRIDSNTLRLHQKGLRAQAATAAETRATEDPDTDMAEAEPPIIPSIIEAPETSPEKSRRSKDPNIDAFNSRTRAPRYDHVGDFDDSGEILAPRGGRKRAAAKPAAPTPTKKQKQEQEPVERRTTRSTATGVRKTLQKKAERPKKEETPPVKRGGRR